MNKRYLKQTGHYFFKSLRDLSLRLFSRFQLFKDRLGVLSGVITAMMALIVFRLFTLQVVEYPFYSALASDQHEIKRILDAKRGEIYLQDPYNQFQQEYPVAVNKVFYQLYAVPQHISDPEEVAEALIPYISKMNEEELVAILSKENDPYEPLERKVPKERYEKIKELGLPGIYGLEETYRYYVEDSIGAHVLGFVGQRDDEPLGLYGIEGHFEDVLAGQEGYIQTERDVAGRWIALSDKRIQESTDGADVVLTIDKNLQLQSCSVLNEAVKEHGAKGGALLVMEPETGKILSMCSNPEFNPNYFSLAESSAVYNNKAIFEAYEPGSVFKPIVMAAGIDLNYVQPDTTYTDEGFIEVDDFTIRNANEDVYGVQTMTNVLENSINTGMIYVATQVGQSSLKDYINRFGFGQLTGIQLDTEVKGNLRALEQSAEVYLATASFGQGITTTPLQLVSAYSALANGGKLMKPYIVQEVRHADGRVDSYEPEVVRQVISPRTSLLMTGMLTSVVSNGQAGNAAVPGYYIAGKTGTAQVADPNGRGYLEDKFNHTFVGFGPADNPRFVILVKLEEPSSARFSASTSARAFQELAGRVLDYMQIPPDTTINAQ